MARQLEHSAAHGDDPPVAIADHEARGGPRIVVLEQFEEESEATAGAPDRLVGQALPPIGIDHAALAIGADVVRHDRIVATAMQHEIRFGD